MGSWQSSLFNLDFSHVIGHQTTTPCSLRTSLPIVAAMFNDVLSTFLTATERGVRVWDGHTGRLLRKFEGLLSGRACCQMADFFFFFSSAGAGCRRRCDALVGYRLCCFCVCRRADIMPGPITAVVLDDRRRKFVVGDALGNVKVFQATNGTFMKGAQIFFWEG